MAAPQDAEEGFYSRGEYCQTCHYKYYDEFDKHTKHDKRVVGCDDCHVPAVAPGGASYSIHDHLFDFSQPEVPCTECHDPGEVQEEETPPHRFNIRPIRFPRNMTLEEACQRCHDGKDPTWVREKMKTLKFQL